MSRTWTPRTSRSGIEYGGSASRYYWEYPLNPGAYYDPSLGTYDLALPNCTTYAYGRILEAGDPAPITGWHNASAWHAYLINGWTFEAYSDSKCRKGDIVEWTGSSGNHVAVVEYINEYGIPCISQSLYTSDNGTASGYRTPAVWGSTKQSVSDYGIQHYPNRFFMYSTVRWSGLGNVNPTYILHNPNSIPTEAGIFKFFGRKKKEKRYIVYG